MDTKITREKHSKIKIDAKLSTEEFAPHLQYAFEHAASHTHLKGFRPGKAPKQLAYSAVDDEKVFHEAVERAVRSTLGTIADDEEVRYIGAPHVELKESKEGLHFIAEVEIFPEITLPDYKKIAKKVMGEAREVEVSEEEMKGAVEWLLKSRKQEELTDSFAQTLGEFKTADELKENIKSGIRSEKLVAEADRKRAKAIEDIAHAAKVDIPRGMVEGMIRQMEGELRATLEAGKTNFDEYVKAHYKDEAGLKKALEERAEKNVIHHLVIHAIAELEQLAPTEEEVKEESDHLMAGTGWASKIDARRLSDYSYGNVQNRKVFRFLEEQK